MRPRIKSRILNPYGGGFTIQDPMTKQEVYGTHFEMLQNRFTALYRANSLPIGLDFDDWLEAQVCARYPDECTVSTQALGIPKVAPGLYDVVRGSAVMMNHKAHGGELVSQQEANRRAEICYRCPMRSQMTLPCARCVSALENVVSVITGSHSTPFDEKLSACGICKCFLAASVWLPLETQCIGVTEEQREAFSFAATHFQCWKNC